ncbi:MAG: PAS domain-containing sensor histidine kinase [Deltaproteobacteria bacterium]|nr:PAS domain-containing sensor histidine kinase [Deltaproteobacteria bacterium]
MAKRGKPGPGSIEAALLERVKELGCLYAISQIAQRCEGSLDAILQEVAGAIRHAWQYPEIASARIVLDGRVRAQAGKGPRLHTQLAPIAVRGKTRGTVEVIYSERRPKSDEGPFLKEERSLLEAVAGQVAAILEHEEAESEKRALLDQLRHADRLATIGQLAAGMAHELNEPLGGILGFAQLARKSPALPAEVAGDIDRIAAAALHARDVIRKLLLFAHQTPPERMPLDLNRLVEEALQLLHSHCEKEAVDIRLALAPDLPPVVADGGQLLQVLTNLVVNALQAMPNGGNLTIATAADARHALLVVEDTGVGIAKDVMDKLFLPFFTTKDVGGGTGLGLPVVHGIVTAHGGSIQVRSKVGQGARFEVRLPLRSGRSVMEAS